MAKQQVNKIQNNLTLPIIKSADLNQELENVVRKGDLESVRKLLEHGVSPDIRSGKVIFFAFQNGLIEISELLLEKSSIKRSPEFWNKCLESYLKSGNAENVCIVELLLNQGADINWVNKDNWSALHQAVTNKASIELIEFLIEKGADLNVLVNYTYGSMPLFQNAVRHGASIDILQMLIDKGLDPNYIISSSLPNLNITALHIALENHSSIEVVQFLLEHGVDPNIINFFGESPLHKAIINGTNLEIIKLLISNGANFNIKNANGKSLLHLAVQYNADKEILNYLIDLGIDLNEIISTKHGDSDEEGMTAIHLAVQHGLSIDKLEFLIERGLNPRATITKGMNEGFNAMYLIREYSKEILDLLEKHGLDPSARVSKGINKGFSVLHQAVTKYTELDVIKFLVEKGNDVNAVVLAGEDKGFSVLHFAILARSDFEIVNYLIQQGADPLVKIKSKYHHYNSLIELEIDYNLNFDFESFDLINLLINQGVKIPKFPKGSPIDSQLKLYLSKYTEFLENPNNLNKNDLVREKLRNLNLEVDEKLITQLTIGKNYVDTIFFKLCLQASSITTILTRRIYDKDYMPHIKLLKNTINELDKIVKENPKFKLKDYLEEQTSQVRNLVNFKDILKRMAEEVLIPYAVYENLDLKRQERLRMISEDSLSKDKEFYYSEALKILINNKSIKELIKLNKFMHKPIATLPAEYRPYKTSLIWPKLFNEVLDLSEGYSIRALGSQEDLLIEGDNLEHCVGNGSYATECSEGKKQILSLQKYGESVATIELEVTQNNGLIQASTKSWDLKQFKGTKNSTPTANDKAAFKEFIAKINSNPSLLNLEAINYKGIDSDGFNSIISSIEKTIGMPLDEPELFDSILEYYRKLESMFGAKII